MKLLKIDKIKVNNILIALVLGSKIISDTVGMTSILLIGIIIAFIINNFEKKIKKQYILSDIFLIIIGGYFILDNLVYGGSVYKEAYTKAFALYFFISIMFVRAEAQEDKIINILIMIYILFSPLFLMKNFENVDSGTLMNYSYDVLPMIIAIIIKIFLIKIKNKKEWILIALTFPYCSFIFTYGSRNIYLASIVCLVICLIIKKKFGMKLFILTITAILTIFIYQNSLEILYNIQGTLRNYNLSFKIIDKNINLIEKEDLGNGRTETYKIALEEFKNEPLTGNGISSFNKKYGTYPHNFILQILYEGGIVLLILFIFPLICGIYEIFFDRKTPPVSKTLLIFLFCNSIMRLLISYEYWREMYFWMFITEAICMFCGKRYKRKEEKNDIGYYTNI